MRWLTGLASRPDPGPACRNSRMSGELCFNEAHAIEVSADVFRARAGRRSERPFRGPFGIRCCEPGTEGSGRISVDCEYRGPFARNLPRGRQGHYPSALHELPSRRRPSAARRRSARSCAPVWRAETGHFEANCSGCHTSTNTTLRDAASYKSIPGHPRWGFAPLSMAWQNKSVGEICRQLKDVKLNGGRSRRLAGTHRQG